MTFWWIVALVLFLAWVAGLDLVGMIILAVVFVLAMLGWVAEVDRRRHRRLHRAPQPYRPPATTQTH